ncbi:MAG: hypothetical protein HY059_03405 [Proteobacteria bacterium]|nr:hypothetical protein [Pseudomonadota bacterium]
MIIGFALDERELYKIAKSKPYCPTHNFFGTAQIFAQLGRYDESRNRAFEYILLNQIACSVATPDAPVAYNFMQLTPGTYRIENLQTKGISMFNAITKFTNPPSFRVSAGEVVYVGDILIGNSALSKVTHGYSEDAAKAALAARNGPVDRLVVRRVSVPPGKPVYE